MAHLTIGNDVASVPGPSERVRALRALSCSLCIRILERIVRVDQILVTPGGVRIGVWVWLLLDRGRVGWNGTRRIVGGREWVRAVRVIRSALLMGYSGVIYARTFRMAKR